MEFNHAKLRGLITEKFGCQANFAAHLKKKESWLSNRLNNKVHFDDEDIYLLCAPENLDIAPDSIHVYFFDTQF